MASVQVLLFARYAELFGGPRLAVSLDQASTVGDLVAALRALPGGNSLPERPFVTVNRTQAGFDQPLGATDEVALLPPMAGG